MLFQQDKIYLQDDVRIAGFATINARHKNESVALDKEGIFIGKNSTIHSFAILESVGGFIVIGEDCSIKEYCLLYGTGGLEIGDFVRVAPHVCIVAETKTTTSLSVPIYRQGVIGKGIKIGNDVWVGANSVILDGIEIGDGSIIGAGSVVTTNVPPYSVAVGNPARARARTTEGCEGDCLEDLN